MLFADETLFSTMKVLVACEESQVVTIALRRLGHEAYSCDMVPCSGGHPEWHLLQNVLPLLEQEWDMIIAFPPCTHLCVSGARWFPAKIADGRQQQGIDFFLKFTNLKCPRIAIENPVGIMSTIYRKPNQIIQPYQFGHNAMKATCLWLKGLPQLIPTNVVNKGKINTYRSGKQMSAWCSIGSRKDRAKIRSVTFEGIGRAMAEQWTLK